MSDFNDRIIHDLTNVKVRGVGGVFWIFVIQFVDEARRKVNLMAVRKKWMAVQTE